MQVSMANGDETEMELAPMQRQVHRYFVVKTSRLRLRAVTVVVSTRSVEIVVEDEAE